MSFQMIITSNSEINETQVKISRLMDIQKTNPPASEQWQKASEIISPLFAKMAEWQKQGLLVEA